jgi:hypothetical protein
VATRTPLQTYLVLQRALDADLLAMLNVTYKSISAELTRLQGRVGIGNAVRADQLRYSLVQINRDLANYWIRAGDSILAQQYLAGAEAAEAALSAGFLRRVLPSGDVDYLLRSARASASNSVVAAMERISGSSYIPLADSVYQNQALASGKIDEIVNAALGRGASAAELATDVRAYINPQVRGGVRYSATRLGRTELNNAFHASSVRQAQKSPWTTGVKWELSGSHPVPDECNDYAETQQVPGWDVGVFRPGDVPIKPHPNCLCYTTTVDVGRDEFLEQYQSGAYDSYLNELGVPGAP